jgi:radical SAM protein
MPAVDFDRAPFLVIWEVTRACALSCVHCRADAIARRDPRELTTIEAGRLIEEITLFGEPAPVLVLTGGDPMWRKDLSEIVRTAHAAGLTVALTPSGTAATTPARLAALKDAGLDRLAVSLDGPDPETHDAFRRVRGSYANTIKIIEAAVDLGLPLQINSTISRRTLADVPRMAARVAEYPISLWAVFFLIQTGRGASLEQITADECEETLIFLDRLADVSPFGIKTTEAPHFRRVQMQRADPSRAVIPAGRRLLRAPRAVNDGNGFVFVDHVGNICPSGFLPLPCGNVREKSLVDVYQHHPQFTQLRNPNGLGGRCGRCEFRSVCGGSRSRAYAATGDVFGEDPLCTYEPAMPMSTTPRLAERTEVHAQSTPVSERRSG